MDTDEIWRAIDDERVNLADQLVAMPMQDWDAPSLCGQWQAAARPSEID
ncbi:hypothetical protein [Mycobacteroides franklinii]